MTEAKRVGQMEYWLVCCKIRIAVSKVEISNPGAVMARKLAAAVEAEGCRGKKGA